MAWTSTDIEALETAIKTGTKSVQFSDRRVEYHSLSEMLRLLAAMKAEVETAAGTRTSTSYATFTKD
jgi:hypothetical protein